MAGSLRPVRHSLVGVALHWTIALAIFFQIIVGWRMGGPSKSAAVYQLYQLHKSVGVVILLLSLVRLGWRFVRPPPPLDPGLSAWQRRAALATHAAFYVIMIGLPLTGWIMVSASKTDIPTLLFGRVPWPHLPVLPHLAPAAKQAWLKAGEAGHGLLVKLTYALLLLHVGAAVKHQLVDKDATLSRMLPGSRPGPFDLRAAAVGAAALLSVGGGVMVFSGAATPPPSPPPVPAAPPQVPPAPPPQSPPPTSLAAPAPVDAPSDVQPARWAVQPASTLGFTSSWSGQAVLGSFRTWTAEIIFDPLALSRSSVEVQVDPASVSTGDAQRDATLPTEDWFDVAKHPLAVFKAASFRKEGDHYLALGRLTLKGQEQPIRLRFTLAIKGDHATADGQASLDRTRFGVGQGEYGGVDQIPAEVALSFHIQADRAGPVAAPHR